MKDPGPASRHGNKMKQARLDPYTEKRCLLIGLFGSYLLAVNSSRVNEYGKRERESLLTTLWKETPQKDTKHGYQQLYNHKQTCSKIQWQTVEFEIVEAWSMASLKARSCWQK